MKTEAELQRTAKPNPPADKIYSTWWWEIELDHSHPRNYNPKVTTLTGYSKLQGHDEAKDKTQTLMKRIIMLATNGYLDRCKYIIIYKRGGNLINKSQDRIICTLLPKRYDIPIENIGKMPIITKFLADLYDHLSTGKNIKNLLPPSPQKFSKDEYFDIARHNFPSQAHLYAYAEQKIKDGHPYPQVQAFVAKYLEQKLFL